MDVVRLGGFRAISRRAGQLGLVAALVFEPRSMGKYEPAPVGLAGGRGFMFQ